MLPVGGGAGAGPPGTARRMTQRSPQHQEHLVTGPGHSARGAAEPCWACCGAGRYRRGTGAYGERSQRISPENAPGSGAPRAAGPPGTARRTTQQSPQHQEHPRLPGRGPSARGRRSGAGAAVRGAAAGRSGAAAQPGSAAIPVTGPAPVRAGGRGTARSAPARAIRLPLAPALPQPARPVAAAALALRPHSRATHPISRQRPRAPGAGSFGIPMCGKPAPISGAAPRDALGGAGVTGSAAARVILLIRAVWPAAIPF